MCTPFFNAATILAIVAAVKNIDAPTLTRVWQELEHGIDVCRVIRGSHITCGSHIEHL
jgi:hypothetical protein